MSWGNSSLGLVAAALGACTEAKPPAPALEVGQVGGASVVVLNIDTFRKDRSSFYSDAPASMPLTTRRPWLVVDGAWSASSWTVPATATQLSGRPVHQHRVRDADMPGDSGALDGVFLTEHLGGLGWETRIYTGNPFFGRVGDFPASAELTLFPDDGAESNAGTLASAALTWVESVDVDQPFFLWFQPMDAHDPWDPQPEDFGRWSDPALVPFNIDDMSEVQQADLGEALTATSDPAPIREAVSAVYDEQLLELDRMVERLILGLDARGRLEDTLVVLTADHGELLFDGADDEYGHAGFLHRAVGEVPLALLHPDLEPGRALCLTAAEDLAPTVLDLLGAPPLPQAVGQSLRSTCRSAVTAEHWAQEELRSVSASTASGRMELRCEGGSAVGFDLANDPGEREPLPVDQVPDAGTLAAALDALVVDVEAVDGTVCRRDDLDRVPH